jgi:very-short-patch-repair endonuclease
MAYVGKTREDLLHFNAEGILQKRAHGLRKEMTVAEKILWEELRNKKVLGLKFRRQHAIHKYIADFYCLEKRLVIEVDGGIHLKPEVAEHDTNRDAELDSVDIHVIRFTNDQIINDPKKVIQDIVSYLSSYGA